MSKSVVSIILTAFIIFRFGFTSSANVSSVKTNELIVLAEDTLVNACDEPQLKQIDSVGNSEISLPKIKNKKRLRAAIMAFPFPFGFMGAHRVLLGTKPWVPIVYVATFGGCFGLIPLIDFCVIIFSKDFEQYENNPNVFMWLK
jgi:TM2 domain-containing membrane protein YozV